MKFVIMTLALSLTSCAHRYTPGNDAVTVIFEEGKARLTDDSKERLQGLRERALASGKDIQEVKILAWADSEYPHRPGDSKTRREEQLAQKRARELRDYLREDLLGREDYEAFNMAKRPNILSRLLKGEDYQVKQSYQKSGATATTLPDGTLSYNKASKAIVIIDYHQERN